MKRIYSSIALFSSLFLMSEGMGSNFSNTVHAQTKSNTDNKPVRILFLLDASSSMLNNWADSNSRFITAQRIVKQLTDSIYLQNQNVEFALRVFGHSYPAISKNCYDSKLEVGFGYKNNDQILRRMSYITPQGFSPIAWSLKEAAVEDFVQSERYAYSIILITDGGESCEGNICETVTQILNKKIHFQPYILSLVDYEPLRKEYDCLGNYLEAFNEKKLQEAIKKIMEDNKVMFKTNNGLNAIYKVDTAVKPSNTVVVTPTPPKTIDTPKVTPTPTPVITPPNAPTTGISRLTFVQNNNTIVANKPTKVSINAPKMATIHPLPKFEFGNKIVEEPTYVKPQIERLMYAFAIQKPTPIAVTKSTLQSPKNVVVKALPKFEFGKAFEEAPPKNIVVTPPPKPVETKPVVSNPSKQTTNQNVVRQPVVPKESKTQQEVTTKTGVSQVKVFFTNGRGKFYTTQPQLAFYSVKDKKLIKTATRSVTTSGDPLPIDLPPGKYVITIPGSQMKTGEVEILENSVSSANITVESGSLAFEYPTNRKKPVSEYYALVSNRFERGPVTKQACDTILPYEPGMYHIEINTLPMTQAFVELSFADTKIISIKEPGTVKVTNTNFTGRIQFWYQRTQVFEPFYDMELIGDPSRQQVDFLPGLYQVYFFKDGEEQMKEFRVKSAETTVLEL